jgi:hypothetical protein
MVRCDFHWKCGRRPTCSQYLATRYVWAVRNTFQGGKWIFAALNPAVVGIDLTIDMKRALITENYGV